MGKEIKCPYTKVQTLETIRTTADWNKRKKRVSTYCYAIIKQEWEKTKKAALHALPPYIALPAEAEAERSASRRT